MFKEAIKQVKELAESVLSGTDFFLVDVEVKGSREPVVWIYIDAEEEDVKMDKCAEVSNELGFLLEAHELFNRNYRLNVSSPGVSSPLKDRRQYPKNKGRKARIKYSSEGKYRKLEGVLREISDKEIVVEEDDGTETSIGFDQLAETKIIPSI